jgi:hypothetical protein
MKESQGYRPLCSSRETGEGNIKIHFQETGYEDLDGVKLAQDRDSWRAVVNTVINAWVSQDACGFLTG